MPEYIRKGPYCNGCTDNLGSRKDEVLCRIEPRWGFRTCRYIPQDKRHPNNPDIRMVHS